MHRALLQRATLATAAFGAVVPRRAHAQGGSAQNTIVTRAAAEGPQSSFETKTACPFLIGVQRAKESLELTREDVLSLPSNAVTAALTGALYTLSPKTKNDAGKEILDLDRISKQPGGLIEHSGSLGSSPAFVSNGTQYLPQNDHNRFNLLLKVIEKDSDETLITRKDLRLMSAASVAIDELFFATHPDATGFSAGGLARGGECELAWDTLGGPKSEGGIPASLVRSFYLKKTPVPPGDGETGLGRAGALAAIGRELVIEKFGGLNPFSESPITAIKKKAVEEFGKSFSFFENGMIRKGA